MITEKGIFSHISGLRALFLIKGASVFLSFTIYSLCVFYFKESYALSHASLMLVFGVFKSGAGFEAISSGASALRYVRKNLITRIVLSLSWLYLIALFLDVKLTPLVLLSIPVALLWLKSFDGHILGITSWSLVYSLTPIITSALLGFSFLVGINSTFLDIDENQSFFTAINVIILLICIFNLRGSLKNTFSEMLHATVSPLLILGMTNMNVGNNAVQFVIYKMFEGFSQIIIFILSSSRSKKIIEYFNFAKLSLIVFIVLLCSLGISHFLGEYLSHLIFGTFIFCYYLSSFFVVKFIDHVNFVLIPLILIVNISLDKIGFYWFQYLIFILPIFLLLSNKMYDEKVKIQINNLGNNN